MYLILAAFIAGLAAGIPGAWHVQQSHIDALQLQLDIVRTEGEAARARAESQTKENERKKLESDHEHEIAINTLKSNVDKLRRARSGARYVSPAGAGARRPGVACYDRAELEQTIRQFVDGVSGIVEKGDERTIELNVARSWVQGLKSAGTRQ